MLQKSPSARRIRPNQGSAKRIIAFILHTNRN
jgi:hypothetical protein